MARTALSPVRPSMDGTAYAPAAVPNADGDAVQPGTALVIDNTDATPLTVTVVTGGTAGSNLAIADISITVPATSQRLVGMFTDDYLPSNDGSATTGMVYVNYSRTTGFTRINVDMS